jgi:DnaK suppressor protein
MVAKKPAAKGAKLKKPAARKAEPVKKSAPAKKAAAARGKPVAARPALAAKAPSKAPLGVAKAAPVAAPKTAPAVTPPAATPKTVKPAAAAAAEKPTVKPGDLKPAGMKPVVKATAKPSSTAPVAKAVTLVRPLLNRQVESDAGGNESDDDSPESPSNLLAGPRNVKPYIARRGEQYMGKEQLEHFRNILNTWKRDLMQEVDRTVLHMKDEAANFPDPNDRATQESEFSLELRTRDRERKLIRKIEEAIKRIDDGSYGYCNETGEEIGIKRLEARPVATLSLEAQERRERREKQYGDRDDRYR